LEKFWRALEWKRLVYSIDIWNILGPFGTYTLWTLGNLVAIWYISPRFETLCQEKSGSPVVQTCFTHFKRKYGLPMHKYCYMSQSPLKRDCWSEVHFMNPFWPKVMDKNINGSIL
jgi:hypothetical protein